jgi:CHAT domain-containing protein
MSVTRRFALLGVLTLCIACCARRAAAIDLEPEIGVAAAVSIRIRVSLDELDEAGARASLQRLTQTRDRLLALTLVEDDGGAAAQWARQESTALLASERDAAAKSVALADSGVLAAQLGLAPRAEEQLDAALSIPEISPATRAEASLWRAHVAVAERDETVARRNWETAVTAAQAAGGARAVVSLCQKAVFELGWETRLPEFAAQVVQTGLQSASALETLEAKDRVRAQLLERAGVFAWNSGLYALAEKDWEEANAAARRVNSRPVLFWTAHHNAVAALVAGEASDVQRAAKFSKEALTLARDLSDSRLEAHALWLKAEVRVAVPEDAIDSLKPALIGVRALAKPEPILETQILISIAAARLRLGQAEQARAAAAAALRVSAGLPWLVRAAATREAVLCGALETFAPVEPDYEEASSGLLPSPLLARFRQLPQLPASLMSSEPAELWDAMESAKVNAMRADLVSAGLQLETGLSQADATQERQQEAVSWLLRRRQGNGNQSDEKLTQRVNTAAADLSELRQKLQERSLSLATSRGGRFLSFSQLSALPPDTAFLSYLRFFDSAGTPVWTLLCVTRNEGSTPQAMLYRLDSSGLPGQIGVWRAACSYPGTGWKSAARAAYERLIAPAAAQLEGRKRLVICPDGALWNVPFAALLDDQKRPLLERFSLYLAASASSGIAELIAPSHSKPARAVVVAAPAFGGPEQFATLLGSQAGRGIAGFDAAGRPITAEGRALTAEGRPISAEGRGLVAEGRAITAEGRPITADGRPIDAEGRNNATFVNDTLRALPRTQDEATMIAKLMPHSTPLVGAAANKSNLLKALNDATNGGQGTVALNLATYAVLLPDSPFQSTLVLAPGKSGDPDSLLTAADIARWKWRGDSAVLSVVGEAGLPADRAALPNLGWAFAAAGTPSLLVAGWPNSTESPVELMRKFYERRLAGEDCATALRNAALELRKDQRFDHPRHWARLCVLSTRF